MGPIDLPSGKQILAGLSIAAAFVAAVTIGGMKLYEHTTENGRTDHVTVNLSDGRRDLIKQGLAGSKDDLRTYLQQQTDAYFKQHGMPCDPGPSGKNLVETLNRAKCLTPDGRQP